MKNASNQALNDFMKPEEIIRQLGLRPGDVIADFGCAAGYFSIPLAKAVGEAGKLYALDILPQMLETVASRAKSAGLTNVETKRVNLEKENGSRLEKDSLNWVVMKDVLFQNKDKELMLKEAYSVLKNGGKIVVIEWEKNNNFIGPDAGLRISREDLKKIMEGCGFVIEKEIDAGDFHYALIAVK